MNENKEQQIPSDDSQSTRDHSQPVEPTTSDGAPVLSKNDELLEMGAAFDFDGFQVVRREFFAHLNEPSVFFNNRYLNSNCKEKENVHATLFAPAANGNPDVILKYTYKGYPMQTYQFNYTNCSTGWKDVKKGAGTKDKVKLIKDVAITIGSALFN